MNKSGTAQDPYSHEYQLDNGTKQLWLRLDVHGKGELDLKGLQKGLEKMDHPMKNANSLLRQIIREADSTGDGKIKFTEFESFVRQTEARLWHLFQTIDTDHDGRVGKKQMHRAFQEARISMPEDRFHDFFSHVDTDGDGFISYRDWRDCLIFMPPTDNIKASLHDVFSFWNSIVTLNAECDSLVSDETLHHTSQNGSLLRMLFGSIVRIAAPGNAEKVQKTQQEQLANGETVPSNIGAPLLSKPNLTSSIVGRKREFAPEMDSSKTAILQKFASSNDEVELSHKVAMVGGALKNSGILAASADADLEDDPKHAKKSLRCKLSAFIPDTGYFIAGAAAGGVSRTATAPLDRLKVYLLVNTSATSGANSIMDALKAGQLFKALGISVIPIKRALRDIYSQGGMWSFFAGNGLNVLKIMPETAIKFGTYEAAKRTMAGFEGHNDTKNLSSISKFLVGGMAGIVAQFCVYPLDTLKFRLQCETVKGGLTGNALVFDTAKRMYQTGGVRSAYRGVTMGLIGMFPYSAIDMSTFEFLKKHYIAYQARRTGMPEEDIEPGNIVTGMIGASSGAFGATVVYPLNVLRTRLQTQGTHMHKATYTGIWDVAAKTVKGEGVRGLYKGLTPNLLKVAPALSITWVVYENAKRILRLE